MKYKFDTTIRAERMKALKKLSKKAKLTDTQFNTREETVCCNEGVFYMAMDDQDTYSADCTLCDDKTGKVYLIRA